MLKGHSYSVRAVDFSPDGKALASASYEKLSQIERKKTLSCFY
jgi:WD40 repeat protein